MSTDQDEKSGLSDFAALLQEADGLPDGRAEVDPRKRRRRRVALAVIAAVLVVALGVPSAYVAWALNAEPPAPVGTFDEPGVTVPGPAAILLPVQGASAISVAGGEPYLAPDAANLFAAGGGNDPRPIASITKLITALVVLDAHPFAGPDDQGPTLTFDAADEDLYDAYYVQNVTVAAMPAGSSMTLRGVLATMLIPSASNYADVVSTWAFGSRGGFLDATRGWLDAQGLVDTTIVDPTGISPRNTSTPTDLLALGRIAAANPDIMAIVDTPAARIGSAGSVRNTNGLLGAEGITGLKTGNLGPGTFAMLYTSALDVGLPQPLAVTGVVLGGSSRAAVEEAVLAQLRSIRDGFHSVPVATEDQDVGGFTTAWGASARLVLAEDASVFTWSDTPITVTSDIRTPKAYADGEVVGTITWSAGPHQESVDVVIDGDIRPPSEWWRLTHPSELGG